MLRHDIKLDNKHDLKLIFRWDESFKMREVDRVKEIYVLKKMNEVHLNETYAENQLKRFRIRKMRAENVEEKKIGLTRSLKNIEKFKEMIEIVEKSFEKNFEMREENFNQIEKLRKNQWVAYDGSKNVAESIDDENEVLENNIMNISFNYNVAENAAAVVKIENETLQDIALKQNFRNEHIKKDVFDENMKFSIKWNAARVVNDWNQWIENIVVVDKIDNKQSNRLTKICLEFNELIKSVNNVVFAAANEISINENWNRIEKEDFEIFNHFYNSKDVQIASLTFKNRSFAIIILTDSSNLSINHFKENDELSTRNISTNSQKFKLNVNHLFDIFSSSTSLFFYLNHIQL